MRNSPTRSGRITNLRRALKSHRQQIGVVVVCALLGLVIVLNVAMAPTANPDRSSTQITYLHQKASEQAVTIQ
jgi:hypothetical protein|tara:strand:- start:1315 stop:1533 length:219 start_codon:yes stop_codon:yes gene_type:complete